MLPICSEKVTKLDFIATSTCSFPDQNFPKTRHIVNRQKSITAYLRGRLTKLRFGHNFPQNRFNNLLPLSDIPAIVKFYLDISRFAFKNRSVLRNL